MNTNQTAKKRSALKKSVLLMIILGVIFALLLIGYFAVLRPLLQKDEAPETVTYPPIWASEVESINGRVLMYPHYERSQINKITVHNPDNAKFGEQYVTWGFYKYTGPEKNDDGLIPGEFYLQNYEYAPFDSNGLANMIVGAGYTLATARVEDHCDDYSRYGLDFKSPEEARSVTMETADGKTFVYYIGDQTPSGGGYYARVVGEDKLLATGQTMERDSVYILTPTNLNASILLSPLKLITPTLTLPFDSQSTELMQSFRIWKNEPKYIVDVEDENGKVTQKIKPYIYLKPLEPAKDPFASFAGMGIYYSLSHPGYYSSLQFEGLTSLFVDFKGQEVLELGKLMKDDDGEEYYGFTDEIREKYKLDNPYITMCYQYQGIDNYVYFSTLQEDSYYYAYSLTFNTICKVTIEQAYFLLWDEYAFLQNQLVYLNIDKCDSIKLTGSYYDLGVLNPDHKGDREVNTTFQLTGTGQNLAIHTGEGKLMDTAEFRDFYQVLISIVNRGMVSEEDGKAAMKGDPIATLSVTTRRSVVYKNDDKGNPTGEIEYELESVSKVFRFYSLTNGRLFCTIEQIDHEGKSSGESGSFYVLSSRLEQLLAATIALEKGEDVNEHQRY
ncbi:MAG: DUF4340 domain-containing protein [Clostridia bacterium]|nr:DUF4340 domain-containing protein [Clostridia bacterium]